MLDKARHCLVERDRADDSAKRFSAELPHASARIGAFDDGLGQRAGGIEGQGQLFHPVLVVEEDVSSSLVTRSILTAVLHSV